MKPLIALFLVITGCDGGGNPKILDDTGSTRGQLVLGAEVIDFGVAEDVGITLEAQLTLQNLGQEDVDILGMAFDGPFSSALTELVVPGMGTVPLGVYFLPTDYAAVEGTLTITSNDPAVDTHVVTFTGGVVVDGDGDGYDRLEAGGLDCDDTDAGIHPGGEEVWYDGDDQDCDGSDDYDQDGDGYQTIVHNEDAENGGGDCNDVVDTVHPGAPDEWYDGVDSNCDGATDWDADQDGYSSAALNKGSDCDDSDPDIHPGAAERFNGVLDNCNGELDTDMRSNSADYFYTGVGADERFGYGLAAGDIDGDSFPDLLFGAPNYNTAGGIMGRGAVAVVLSSVGLPTDGSTLQSAWHLFQGQAATSGLGFGLAVVDDYNGNGQADLLVGAPGDNSYGGAIYIIDSSAILAWGGTQNRHTEIRGGSGLGYYVGRGMVNQVDLDGDAVSDVIFEYSVSSSTGGAGRIGIQYGGTSGIVDISSVDVRLDVETSSLNPTKEALSQAMDVDGDGYDDWVYGDSGNDAQGTNSGAVWVVWGQAAQGAQLSQVVAGEGNDGAGFATAFLPDLDGDNIHELAWWGEADSELHLLSAVDLRSGGIHGASDSFAVLTFPGGSIPGQIASIGDWNDDGAAEWIVSLDGEVGSGNGESYVYWGAGMSGSYEADDDFLASFDPKSDDYSVDFGHRIIGGGTDVNQDGRLDLVASDPLYEGDMDGDGIEDEEVGAVYLFLNEGM